MTAKSTLYYRKNRHLILARKRARYANDAAYRARVLGENKEYRARNPQKMVERRRRPEVRAYNVAYLREYYRRNRDRLLTAEKDKRRSDSEWRERRNSYVKQWRNRKMREPGYVRSHRMYALNWKKLDRIAAGRSYCNALLRQGTRLGAADIPEVLRQVKRAHLLIARKLREVQK